MWEIFLTLQKLCFNELGLLWTLPDQVVIDTEQNIKFSINDFFIKCDHIHRKLRICSHLLKKLYWKTSFFHFFKLNLRNPCFCRNLPEYSSTYNLFPFYFDVWQKYYFIDTEKAWNIFRIISTIQMMIGYSCVQTMPSVTQKITVLYNWLPFL